MGILRLLAPAAAGAAVLTLLAQGQATAQPVAPDGAQASYAGTRVTARYEYGVHRQPNNGTERLSYVVPGESYVASCWIPGQNVRVGKVTHHIWILVDRTWPKPNGYVPAAALRGGGHAGVPDRC